MVTIWFYKCSTLTTLTHGSSAATSIGTWCCESGLTYLLSHADVPGFAVVFQEDLHTTDNPSGKPNNEHCRPCEQTLYSPKCIRLQRPERLLPQFFLVQVNFCSVTRAVDSGPDESVISSNSSVASRLSDPIRLHYPCSWATITPSPKTRLIPKSQKGLALFAARGHT